MKVYIIGAGGHAQVVWDTLEECGIHPEGFLDDIFPNEATCASKKIVGKVEDAKSISGLFIVAIGDNAKRKQVISRLNLSCECYLNVIHPRSFVSKKAQIGMGNMVIANAVINAYTKIGDFSIINTSASIDHHNIIEDFVHVGPGVHTGGNVHIKEGAFVGIGASIIPNITIGKWAVVGAGSVVINDVPDYAIVVGNPGRIIKMKGETV